MAQIQSQEVICQSNINLTSPIEIDDELFLVGENGNIFKHKDDSLKVEHHFEGQPSGMAIDKSKIIFLADLANQAIMLRNTDESEQNTQMSISHYKGIHLIGPNSLVFSDFDNCLYFTDSGPMGETSLEQPKGSVYALNIEVISLDALAFECLAYPSGICLTQDEKVIYVSETNCNRILRFIQSAPRTYKQTVFHQFSGRFGPMSITTNSNDHLFVARYEFQHLAQDGLISILNNSGIHIGQINVMGSPQISGLTFSKTKTNMLYITENSNNQSTCTRIIIKFDEHDDDKDRINM